jgi:hypothetical protein
MTTPLNQPLVAYRTEHLSGIIRNPAFKSISQGTSGFAAMSRGGTVNPQAGSFATPAAKFGLMPIHDQLTPPPVFALQAVPNSRLNKM